MGQSFLNSIGRRGDRLRTAVLIVCAACSFVAVHCGVNAFAVDEDSRIGMQMDNEIRTHPDQYPILQNDQVTGYIQGIVNQIIQAPQIKYRGKFPYKVTVINDDKTINAFATPGGYIYVYTGLLRFLENEASLAGVLGHEIAHSEERHGTEHMTNQLGVEVALSLALGNNPSKLAEVAGNAAALLVLLRNSRDDETEADGRSFTYLQSTPYWPGAIKGFFERMLEKNGGRSQGALEEWTSTHPLDQTRIDHINTLLRENNTPAPTNASLRPDPYRQMLRQLR
jgi:predicted Zn-dependent protease